MGNDHSPLWMKGERCTEHPIFTATKRSFLQIHPCPPSPANPTDPGERHPTIEATEAQTVVHWTCLTFQHGLGAQGMTS